ncbi:MAG: hypothetical protein ACRDYZ_15435 [Acidimicrobiales bacterium]
MQRRFLLPHLILGVLSLLAAGAAISSVLVWAPTGTDLAVHNAAGAVLHATTVVGKYTQTTLRGETINFAYHAPDRVTAHFSGPVKGVSHAPQSTTGAAAKNVLSPVSELTTLKGFNGHGSLYLVAETIKQLVAPTQRAAITGTFRAVATVTTGYVVRVQEHIAAKQGGRQITDHIDYRLNRVDGWTRS